MHKKIFLVLFFSHTYACVLAIQNDTIQHFNLENKKPNDSIFYKINPGVRSFIQVKFFTRTSKKNFGSDSFIFYNKRGQVISQRKFNRKIKIRKISLYTFYVIPLSTVLWVNNYLLVNNW